MSHLGLPTPVVRGALSSSAPSSSNATASLCAGAANDASTARARASSDVHLPSISSFMSGSIHTGSTTGSHFTSSTSGPAPFNSYAQNAADVRAASAPPHRGPPPPPLIQPGRRNSSERTSEGMTSGRGPSPWAHPYQWSSTLQLAHGSSAHQWSSNAPASGPGLPQPGNMTTGTTRGAYRTDMQKHQPSAPPQSLGGAGASQVFPPPPIGNGWDQNLAPNRHLPPPPSSFSQYSAPRLLAVDGVSSPSRRWSGSGSSSQAPSYLPALPCPAGSAAAQEPTQRRNTTSFHAHSVFDPVAREEATLTHTLQQVRRINSQRGLALVAAPSSELATVAGILPALKAELLQLRLHDVEAADRLAADIGLDLYTHREGRRDSQESRSSGRASPYPENPMDSWASAPSGLAGAEMDVDMLSSTSRTLRAPRRVQAKHPPKRLRKRENERHQQCLGCEVVDTPEWRKGPTGNRTLCNACGLLYAKQSRRRAKEAAMARREPASTTQATSLDEKQANLEELRAAIRARSSSSASAAYAPDSLPTTRSRGRGESLETGSANSLDSIAALRTSQATLPPFQLMVNFESPAQQQYGTDAPNARPALPSLSSLLVDRQQQPQPHQHVSNSFFTQQSQQQQHSVSYSQHHHHHQSPHYQQSQPHPSQSVLEQRPPSSVSATATGHQQQFGSNDEPKTGLPFEHGPP